MSHTVSLIGRLRIERLVWELDQRLWELPRRRRVDCRREVRANVLAAARESGVTAALRGVGSAGELARGYKAAEYGDRQRPHWWAAGMTALVIAQLPLLMQAQVTNMNEAAIRAVSPHATGAYTVPGVVFLQHATVYTFSNGQATLSGGDLSPLFYAAWLVSVILIGRLWRVRIRRRQVASPEASTGLLCACHLPEEGCDVAGQLMVEQFLNTLDERTFSWHGESGLPLGLLRRLPQRWRPLALDGSIRQPGQDARLPAPARRLRGRPERDLDGCCGLGLSQ
jgi:hypothetical protein